MFWFEWNWHTNIHAPMTRMTTTTVTTTHYCKFFPFKVPPQTRRRRRRSGRGRWRSTAPTGTVTAHRGAQCTWCLQNTHTRKQRAPAPNATETTEWKNFTRFYCKQNNNSMFSYDFHCANIEIETHIVYFTYTNSSSTRFELTHKSHTRKTKKKKTKK